MRFCGRCGDMAADTTDRCECGCLLVPFRFVKDDPQPGWGDSASVRDSALSPEPKAAA